MLRIKQSVISREDLVTWATLAIAGNLSPSPWIADSPSEWRAEIGMAVHKGSAIRHSTALVAGLLAVGLGVGFCKKGLSMNFEEIKNLLLDIPVVLLAPAF